MSSDNAVVSTLTTETDDNAAIGAVAQASEQTVSRPPSEPKKKMKVTLLSGFLGAGKTTLLKRILTQNNDGANLKLAVIVNDMGEINLDANAIKESKLVQEEAEMIEMQNGCICCTLRGDLLRTVKSLSNEGKYDNLIIESTGISEPLPVAQTFVMDIDSAVQPGASPAVATSELKSLSHFATLDTCVTVVDALNVFEVLGSIETLADKNNIANMLGNTGARDYNTDTEQLTAIVQALEWQSLALTDTSMSVQKLVAEMVESPEVLVKHATRIRKQVPGLERVEDSQVLAAAIEISNKYKLREQAAKGGKEGEAAIAAMTAANAAAIKAHEAAQNTDDRSLSQLMLDQIEFANVILISKAALFLSQHSGTDTDGEKKLGMIKGLMKKLNPKARVIIPRADQYGDLDTAELLNTGAFNMREAQTSPGWLQELQQGHHVPETEEYGITSLVFQDKSMPFHPARLRRILNGFGSYESAIAMGSSLLPAPAPAPETASSPELPDQQQAEGSSNAADKVTKSGFTKSRGCFEGVVRAKGFIWLANANAFPISFHAAGKQVNVEGGQRPFAAVMASKETAERMVKAGKWTDMYGDRESCVVFIGVGLNKTLMMKALKEALLTEEESCELGGVQGWAKLEDPFFDGTAAETYMDIPEYLKQHFARQQAGQRHPGQKVFECKFTWDQTSSEIRICVTLPPGTVERDISCKVTETTLKLGFGSNPPFINEAFTHKVKADSCNWELKDGSIHINCAKSNPGVAWSSAIEDED